MEIVDNLVIIGMPGALEAGLDSVFFWVTLALSLGVAFVVTVPVNRELLRRGKGHAAIHRIHEARGRGIGPPSRSSAHRRSKQRKPERVLVQEDGKPWA